MSILKALVREKKVTFELSAKQQSNAEYLSKLDASIEQANRGEVVKYTMDEFKALVEGE